MTDTPLPRRDGSGHGAYPPPGKIQPGDQLPTSPPLTVLATRTLPGRLELTVDLPADHPIAEGLRAHALHGTTTAAVTALIGHPGTGADEDQDEDGQP